jgi:putative N6-adenine-specific DNA methylase
VRIERDRCTLSLDSSGEPLHRRGLKPEVSAAPLRETLAAGMLRMCGYTGDEPLLDPMCGSGTLVIEAAGLALHWPPGAARTFSFMDWSGFEEPGWGELCRWRMGLRREAPGAPLFASDRNGGAVATTRRNLDGAGLGPFVTVERRSLSDLEPPAESGLLVCNPPYGKRLGKGDPLAGLYAELGQVLRDRFVGWRVGLVTNQRRLADATGLSFEERGPQLRHGGIRIRLYRAGVWG